MKDAYRLENVLDKSLLKGAGEVLQNDKLEIDNRNRHHRSRINYYDRIDKILSTIHRCVETGSSIHIGDFGCAQGNLALLLAESGFRVTAVDRNSDFISYAKCKYEFGRVNWICAGIEEMESEMEPESLHFAVVGELIEHCAYPEDILTRIAHFVRPNGYIMVTTPNGSSLYSKVPPFSLFKTRESRGVLQSRQFGHSGSSHLFHFKLKDIASITPSGFEIVEEGYLGGSIWIDLYLAWPFLLLPPTILQMFARGFCSIPIVNRLSCNNIYTLMVKRI
ncbi:MAG: methyltransferase domain-containing protein [Desulfobacterales bacterium]|nr:methyltransferase domain-containing protein [Desulfobacterales bacterium]